MLGRRRFLKLTTGATLMSTAGAVWPGRLRAEPYETLVERARAVGEDRVVFAGPGGAFGNNLREHFFQSFTDETGIAVVHVGSSNAERMAGLRAMNEVGVFEWDIMTHGGTATADPAVALRLLLHYVRNGRGQSAQELIRRVIAPDGEAEQAAARRVVEKLDWLRLGEVPEADLLVSD